MIGLLNKRNGLSRDLTMKPGQAFRVGDVIVRLRACETSAPWEAQKLTGAFVQVDVRNPQDKVERVFSGWLYKETPSLNVVEHPVYDVWPKSCAMTHPDAGASTVRAGSASKSRSSAPNSAASPSPAPGIEPSAPMVPATAPAPPPARRRQRRGQQPDIILLLDLDRAHAAQMIGHELAIEQAESADPQPRHQPGQRDLRRVGAQ